MDTINGKKLAIEIARAVEEAKGQSVIILNVEGISMVTDYYVIASADNTVHLKALADRAQERLKELGERPLHVEGYGKSGWILMDCGDVVIHLFLEERREFFGLERLWGDAPKVDFSGGVGEDDR